LRGTKFLPKLDRPRSERDCDDGRGGYASLALSIRKVPFIFMRIGYEYDVAGFDRVTNDPFATRDS
jgi:hypothetical protein